MYDMIIIDIEQERTSKMKF